MLTAFFTLHSSLVGISVQTFDEIHRKKITLSQAARALNMLGVQLTVQDTKELEGYCDAYEEFEYQRFADEMNKGMSRMDPY